jgi:glycosyltransferase involved in cell wall biosynthesis
MTGVAIRREVEAALVPVGARRRIVILTEDSKPALGGIAEYLHQLALAAATTHDVVIVTSVAGAEALNPGLPFRYREVGWFRAQWHFKGDRFAPIRRWNSLMWRLGTRSRVRDLLAAIHAEHPDSTYVLGRLSPVTHAWCRACRDLGLTYSVVAHGLELIEPLPPLAAARRRTDMAAASFWFANSADTAQALDHLGVTRERVAVLHPGVTGSHVPLADARRTAVRARFGLGARRFVLSVCHLRARKGIDLALRALAALGSDARDVAYVIAGTGPEEDALRRLAQDLGVADRTVFAGAVTEADKTVLLAECAFFVLPTRRMDGDVEGFGIVFLEAGWHGKAVIGGRNGGVPEAVEDGVTGILVETESTDQLTAAMRRLLGDPIQAAAMGQRGAARAREDFSWQDRAKEFSGRLETLSRVVRPPASRRPSTPIARLRRYAGTTSNRVVSSAYVLGELARTERLSAYAARRTAPDDLAHCSEEILGWLRRAFVAGNGGGAAASYHLVHGWAAAYPEVTGYLIPTLLYYAGERDDPTLAALAHRAGDWLARTRLPSGAICRKQWFVGNNAPSVFNTAQVIDGWCALSAARAASDGDAAKWLALACQAGDWLVGEQERDGSWVRNAFNGISHSYYARVAAPLARLGMLTGVPRYVASARAAADWVVSRQTKTGWFNDAGFSRTEPPTTHTIGYVIEGLVTCGTLLGEPRYVDAADRAAEVLLAKYETGRALPGRFAAEWRPHGRWRCLTGDAQIAISWCLLAVRNNDQRYRRAAASVANDIRQTVRVIPEWPDISGGVQGSSPPWGEYDQFAYPTHAAKFTLDLLALLDQ